MFNQELMDKWCNALESGCYEQGQGSLRDGDTYCCLGVLCDVMKPNGWETENDTTYSWRDNTTHKGVLGFQTRFDIGLDSRDQNTLVTMNDGGKSFDEISSWIRENLGEEGS